MHVELACWGRCAGVLMVVPGAPDAAGRRRAVDHLGRVLNVREVELVPASGPQVTSWVQEQTWSRLCAVQGVADG